MKTFETLIIYPTYKCVNLPTCISERYVKAYCNVQSYLKEKSLLGFTELHDGSFLFRKLEKETLLFATLLSICFQMKLCITSTVTKCSDVVPNHVIKV